MQAKIDTILPKFDTKFPEFDLSEINKSFEKDNVSLAADALIQLKKDAIALALTIYDVNELGTLYLAAHFFATKHAAMVHKVTSETHTNSEMALTSMSVGAKSASFATMVDNNEDNVYTTTNYGLNFLQIKRGHFRLGVGVA